MLKFFAEKMWVAFAVQKLLTFFSAKNIRILYIDSTKTLNEMTLNELVKLTTLWTTGPGFIIWLKRYLKAIKAEQVSNRKHDVVTVGGITLYMRQ